MASGLSRAEITPVVSGLSRTVTHIRRLLESRDVEAPVVIGWRRPALILPTDVTERLSADMVAALLAHEFAHVKRQDYLANALQSVVELLLFFSPAVKWISRCIREAREYCCDDVAVARCGNPKDYVQALTTLASLGTLNSARPVVRALKRGYVGYTKRSCVAGAAGQHLRALPEPRR